jgi:glycosyltransferase involved in cell wall biosynthesis
LRVGGAEVLAARLARQLREIYRFRFVCLDELGEIGEQLEEEGFTVKVVHRRPGVDWHSMFELARILRREQVALLHAHQYTPFFYALMARLLGRQVPVLFTEHGRHFPDYPRRKRVLANRLLLRRCDRVVGVGESVGQALIANEGLPPHRVEIIHNGIDCHAFASRGTDRRALRDELGVAAGDLVLVQVARLDYLKDHATAIRTMERVIARIPTAKLFLIGDGPERGTLEQLIRQRKLTDCVRLLGSRNDVARLLSTADLFLLTSISEGIPLTVLEAMSAGLPIISTRVGGIAEVVSDGVTGFLAAAGDDLTLSEHVLRLGADPALRSHMGDQGHLRARTFFSEVRMHNSYQRLYEEMLRG